MRIEILDGSKVVGTILADEEFAEANYPGAWRIAAVQPEETQPPAPEWTWLLDLAPFTDRLGAAATAIDLSTATPLVAIRSDFARRKWIDLKDPRVIAAVHYLAGQPHPVLGTLDQALLTAAQADTVLNAPVLPAENLALRKVYFNA